MVRFEFEKEIEWGAKDFFARSIFASDKIFPDFFDTHGRDFAKFFSRDFKWVEAIPFKTFESIGNLRFAIRTIAASLGITDEKEIDELVRQTKENYIRSQIETIRFLRGGLKDRPAIVTPEVSTEIKDFIKAGKGIFASFHSGNGFLSAESTMSLIKKYGDPNLKIGIFVEKQPPAIWSKILPFFDSMDLTPIDVSQNNLLEKIRETDFLISLFDRPTLPENEVNVNFFGKPAVFDRGVALLSLGLHRPILPGAVVKNSNGYEVKYGHVVSPKPYSVRKSAERIKLVTQAVLTELEPIIAENLTSFYLFEPLWLGERERTGPLDSRIGGKSRT